MPSIEKERAAFAWQKVQNCSNDYANLAKAAPALIMTNGLMQTLAFFASKKKPHHDRLNGHIFEWLKRRTDGSFKVSGNHQEDFKEVMNYLNNSDSASYRRATEEVLALLRWVRQFASAVNAGKQGDEP
jgi:CRISPR-associated protein Cmr5